MDFSAFSGAAFWAALLSIIVANILLSGDNAVVIALASRNLPAGQQKKAIFIAFSEARAFFPEGAKKVRFLRAVPLDYIRIQTAGLLFRAAGPARAWN